MTLLFLLQFLPWPINGMTYNQAYDYIKQYLITSTAGTLCTGIVGVDYEATIISAVEDFQVIFIILYICILP